MTVSTGTLIGSTQNGIDSFLGVPYAAPPVGDQRFRLPAAAVPWDGVRDATTHGATAPQAPFPGALGELLTTVEIPGDEYLNLTVWTPSKRAAKLPVMVWIHGGSLTRGSNAVPGYNGTQFARDGVVFVGINYRVGVEGFSVLDGAPLNLGIADQFAALRWVQAEIENFGGDPRQVTVFGESAGGNSIAALLAHPDAPSLFRAAIIQSGPLNARSRRTSGRLTRLIAKKLGISTTRDAFAAVSSADLVAAQSAVTAGSTPISGGASVSMAIGEDVVPTNPETALCAGAGDGIPLLIGTNTEEYRLWVLPSGLISTIGRRHIAVARLAFRIRGRTMRTYRANRPGASSGELFGVLATDLLLRLPMNRLADARLARHAKTWVYEFAWRSPVLDLGAAHALEIGFVFDGVDHPDSRKLAGTDAPQSIATDMHDAWVRFAKTGDPGWPAWDATRPVRLYDVPVTTVHAPREDERASWS
ncbi:MAG: carboxylesterase family protein [Rhodoglobus sp.]